MIYSGVKSEGCAPFDYFSSDSGKHRCAYQSGEHGFVWIPAKTGVISVVSTQADARDG